MSHFVLELGVEELPARFLASLERELNDRFAALFAENGLTYDSISVSTTPRRAVLQVRGLLEATPVREEVALGPSLKAAYDAEGNPTKAAQGFARGQGVDVADLFQQETPKGVYVAARKTVGGASASSIIAEAAPALIGSLPFPKRMHWGESRFLFARPLRWVLALMDKDVVSFKVADIESGRMTTGHRVHGKGPFEVCCACKYDAVLAEKCGVTVSGANRRKAVIEGGDELAKAVDGRVMWKDSLLDEVQGLSEHPVPVLGDFDPSFLELPSIVLLTSMETHQKSFGVESQDGKLLPHFLTVSNVSSLEPALVKKGWERVLRARLEDARFYWNTDMKASFEVWKEKLDHVIFLGPLGSMGDKCRRLSALCEWLAAQPGIAEGKVSAASAAVAGRCAKADLVSQMVGEFDTLQGIMGGIYGHKMGLDPVAADALAEQYLPAGPDTPVPATDLGAILSMADKADTLVGCFGLGNIPTGAADPFALRRCALGIARILIEKGWRLPVEEFFAKAQSLYADDIRWKLEKPEALAKLNDFFAGRVKNLFLTQGNDTLLVEAVMNAGSSDVWAASRRLAALAAEAAKPGFADNAQTFKRVTNILRKQGADATGAFRTELLAEEPEKALAAALTDMAAKFDALWAEDCFDELLALMDGIRPAVDAFFDGVMVMAEEPELRANRLDLLQALLSKMGRLADFSALQM
ncbi:glycine--tRNA ligase subunit beta [Mailhella sp.]|uniref:glycine--tRNA ligase subunit beta n=1 Tax=Mailhella sp. TaxID=1981029 RepID=UPI004064731E